MDKEVKVWIGFLVCILAACAVLSPDAYRGGYGGTTNNINIIGPGGGDYGLQGR